MKGRRASVFFKRLLSGQRDSFCFLYRFISRSQSLGPPVPDAGSKPKGPEVPDKGKKPRKIGFLTPSFDTSVVKETTVVALPSVEEDLEGERTPSSKATSNDQTDSDKDVVNVKEDSKEPKDDTKEVTSVFEEDKEKTTTTKEISCDASASEKPLPLAFDAPPAIEYKQVEKSHAEDNNGSEECGQDEKEEHVPGKSSSEVEEAQEKWKDVIEVALKANTEEQEEEHKHEQKQVQEHEKDQKHEQEQVQEHMLEKEQEQKEKQNPEPRQVQEEEQVSLVEQEEEPEPEKKKDILSKPEKSEKDVVDQVPGEEDNNNVILKEVKKEENDESDKSGTSTSKEISTKVHKEEEADILEVKVEENEEEVQSIVASASICCEKEEAEESYGESSLASSLGEEKVEKVDDAKIVTIGDGESEDGGIVDKCEEDDLKTEPIDKE